MKLGIGSYAYAWAIGVPDHTPVKPMTASGLLERARALGVGAVQYDDNLSLLDLGPADLDVLLGRAEDYSIAVEIGARGISSQNMVRQLELARRVRAKFVRFVVDSKGDEPTPAEVISRIKPHIPVYSDAGVIFAIENHDRYSVANLVDIIEALGPTNAGICLDTVNSLGSLEMPDKVVAALAPYTVNLHVKDFQLRRVPSQMGFEVVGCAAGQGRLEIPWVLSQIRGADRDVNAIIELWPPLLGSIEATIDQEDRWAQDSVQYMLGLIQPD